MKQRDIDFLKKITDFEDTYDMGQFRNGWRYHHVGIQGSTLSNLAINGYVNIVSQSSNHTGYRLSELGRSIINDLSEKNGTGSNEKKQPLEIDEGIFSDIIGHQEEKELLIACLLAEKPVHALLAGPPALAKSLFLWDIERTAGEQAIWLIGSATSKAGLWDAVADHQPQILLIDELSTMSAADTAGLLSMMEGGRLVRAKRGRELNLKNQLRVVAASNYVGKLSPELKSRFAIRKLKAYNRGDYLAVVRGVLVTHEGMDEKQAEEIAKSLDGISQDVRDAVRVARLTPRLGIRKAVRLIIGGDEN